MFGYNLIMMWDVQEHYMFDINLSNFFTAVYTDSKRLMGGQEEGGGVDMITLNVCRDESHAGPGVTCCHNIFLVSANALKVFR